MVFKIGPIIRPSTGHGSGQVRSIGPERGQIGIGPVKQVVRPAKEPSDSIFFFPPLSPSLAGKTPATPLETSPTLLRWRTQPPSPAGTHALEKLPIFARQNPPSRWKPRAGKASIFCPPEHPALETPPPPPCCWKHTPPLPTTGTPPHCKPHTAKSTLLPAIGTPTLQKPPSFQ